MTLHLSLRWNQYYQTTTDSAATQHSVTAVHQTQSGLNNHVWIKSELANTAGLGLDCQVCVQNLHHRLDGVRSVDSTNPEDSLLAIKTSRQLDRTDLTEIDNTIEWQLTGTPTIALTTKVNDQAVLHQLTVDKLVKCSAPDGHDLSLSELQQILMQAARQHQAALHPQVHGQAASIGGHTHAGLARPGQLQPQVLQSRVLHHHLPSARQHTGVTATSSNVSSRLTLLV